MIPSNIPNTNDDLLFSSIQVHPELQVKLAWSPNVTNVFYQQPNRSRIESIFQTTLLGDIQLGGIVMIQPNYVHLAIISTSSNNNKNRWLIPIRSLLGPLKGDSTKNRKKEKSSQPKCHTFFILPCKKKTSSEPSMDKTSHIFPKLWTKTLMFRGTQVFEFGHPRAIALRKAALVENFQHIHFWGVSKLKTHPKKINWNWFHSNGNTSWWFQPCLKDIS